MRKVPWSIPPEKTLSVHPAANGYLTLFRAGGRFRRRRERRWAPPLTCRAQWHIWNPKLPLPLRPTSIGTYLYLYPLWNPAQCKILGTASTLGLMQNPGPQIQPCPKLLCLVELKMNCHASAITLSMTMVGAHLKCHLYYLWKCISIVLWLLMVIIFIKFPIFCTPVYGKTRL